MTTLHVHFALKNQHAFQRLLEGGSNRGQPAPTAGTSSSSGRSWNRPSTLTAAMTSDVNAKDWLGRTVLHLACSDPASIEYVRLLLTHPAINVNIQDTESHWTALHRALYHGNISAAILLLKRADIDTSLTDLEGYRAFDLYNTTVEDTKPIGCIDDLESVFTELFTWGANRNAALGHGDNDDKSYPEQVTLRTYRSDGDSSVKHSIAFKLRSPSIQQVAMSKLHTVVVTSEPRANLRLCGFASTGRLGPGGGQHSVYTLSPMPQFEHTIVSVALGRDHTLALTSVGTVLSWGLNRFSQLGYVVEATTSSRLDEPVQSTPRIVAGALKREFVEGVAASKSASACWTGASVYTWGKNSGQLGYDSASQPIQVQPRLVTKVNKPVLAVSMNDTAMACLLTSQEVILLYNNGHTKISFPAQGFPSEIMAYRPPQAVNNANIAKVVCNDNMFAAISSNGEIFTFAVPTERELSTSKDKVLVKPQRVWALRKQWSAVRDAALGSDGTIMICTESGHVFVRSRNLKSGQGPAARMFKFQRIPYLQRVVAVGANDTGAMSAIRSDIRPRSITIFGNSLSQDLARIRPYLSYRKVLDGHDDKIRIEPGMALHAPEVEQFTSMPPPDDDDDSDDLTIEADITELKRLWDVVVQDRLSRQKYNGRGIFEGSPLAHGADLLICVRSGNFVFPAHRLVLAARCLALSELSLGEKELHDRESGISVKLKSASSSPDTSTDPSKFSCLTITGCHPLSVLILIHYFYSDELLAVWDNRVVRRMQMLLAPTSLQLAGITRELQGLSRALDLPNVGDVTCLASKRNPEPTLNRHMGALFAISQDAPMPGAMNGTRSPLAHDVVLELADRQVFCHSTVLRARTPFFGCFFDDPDWAAQRWSSEGVISVNLQHLNWRAMEYVLRFICCGEEDEMFERLDFIDSVDGFLNFMFEVMSDANELLLDRLLLICSSVLLNHVNIHNVCRILSDAAHLHCPPLIKRLHWYMAVNMETLLESQMLDELTPRLVKDLSISIREGQLEKSPAARSGCLVDGVMKKNEEWLTLQDIPQPIARSAPNKYSPKLSPKRSHRRPSVDPFPSPSVRPAIITSRPPQPVSSNDVFEMDDADLVPALNLDSGTVHAPDVPSSNPASKAGPWKAKSVNPRPFLAEAKESKLTEMRGQRSSTLLQPLNLKTPPKDQLKTSWPLPTESQDPRNAGPSNASWRVAAAPSGLRPINVPNSRPSPTETPIHTPPNGRGEEILRPELHTSTPTTSRTAQSAGSGQASTTPTRPGLGPVITPSKQSQSKGAPSISRRVSSGGSAWTLPPVQPVVQSSLSSSTMSFAAIQQLQHEQGIVPIKDKRSLKEIQEEERARQTEEEFLKWWAAEEERVRLESAIASASAQRAGGSKRKKGATKGAEKGEEKRLGRIGVALKKSATLATTSDSPRQESRKDHTLSKRNKIPSAKSTTNSS
ncbi:hypothetical protein EW146_g3853 [Bondarzewia mesenterica]|uniref:BTB domain-containing protein n=1 Tax=Bondarzewia mesenterica TaxID=1095465 RepID=A0A4S4LWG9_9AGAM|nr:hypothetical protein EW146_g3853 [Bondarzewia mesenterica]